MKFLIDRHCRDLAQREFGRLKPGPYKLYVYLLRRMAHHAKQQTQYRYMRVSEGEMASAINSSTGSVRRWKLHLAELGLIAICRTRRSVKQKTLLVIPELAEVYIVNGRWRMRNLHHSDANLHHSDADLHHYEERYLIGDRGPYREPKDTLAPDHNHLTNKGGGFGYA